MQSVCSAHGRPRPTRMSNTLLPMELEMAMSPIPEARRATLSRSVYSRETSHLWQAVFCCGAHSLNSISVPFPLNANTDVDFLLVYPPCRATITLAMQSGTLVPAARKVIPIITSGIPRVKPITVTWNRFSISQNALYVLSSGTVKITKRKMNLWN